LDFTVLKLLFKIYVKPRKMFSEENENLLAVDIKETELILYFIKIVI
jgi:hypothetical protein